MPAEQRVSAEAIVDAYRATGSVWKAAARLGVCGQSVWERLRGLNIDMPNRRWSAEEVQELKRLIPNQTLNEVARALGRPYAGVACMASRLGLVTRYGNRIKRKVPRGSGLTKPLIAGLLRDLAAWKGSIVQFCRSRGLSLDTFALAVQQHEPDAWRTLAWQRGLAEKVCPGCQSPFFPMTNKQIGCSRRCTERYRRDQRYFGGKRNTAIGLSEGVCQLCQQAKKSLQAHHMLGKENDPTNEWLIALCAGCHKLVTLAATRKVLDSAAGWERFIELVLARRLAEQEGAFVGTHVAVDIEWLTEDELVDLGLLKEAS